MVGGQTSTDKYRVSQARKIVRLISESKLGQGLVLEEMAASTGALAPIVAKIIVEANDNNVFCPSADKLSSLDGIKDYISAQSKK